MSESSPKPLPHPENSPLPLYIIRKAEFLIPLRNVELYNMGDKVTRANWADWLLKGFAISIGVPEVQTAFMQWHKVHHNFDWEQTNEIVNTLSKLPGRWDFLNDEELAHIGSAYRNITRHIKPDATNNQAIDRAFIQIRPLKEKDRLQQFNLINSEIGDLVTISRNDLQPTLSSVARKLRKERDEARSNK